jgi:nicotinamidase-related amidase
MAEKHSSALLVIDVQASFPHTSYWQVQDVAAYLAEQNRLISGCVTRGVSIVRIFHAEESGVFSLASGLVRPMDGLIDFNADCTLTKHAHSAFAGTALAAWLTAHGIGRVIVSGIRSEQCCETTTRDASDRGFKVDYVTDATLTFAMRHLDGEEFSPSQIKRRTELVLHDRFAAIVNVDQALARIDGVTTVLRSAA